MGPPPISKEQQQNSSQVAVPRNGSSHIGEFSYDDQRNELSVTFRNGRSYTYEQVPKEIFERMCRDWSAGRYFHQVVRRHYKVKR